VPFKSHDYLDDAQLHESLAEAITLPKFLSSQCVPGPICAIVMDMEANMI
jgi:hypothetical protein